MASQSNSNKKNQTDGSSDIVHGPVLISDSSGSPIEIVDVDTAHEGDNILELGVDQQMKEEEELQEAKQDEKNSDGEGDSQQKQTKLKKGICSIKPISASAKPSASNDEKGNHHQGCENHGVNGKQRIDVTVDLQPSLEAAQTAAKDHGFSPAPKTVESALLQLKQYYIPNTAQKFKYECQFKKMKKKAQILSKLGREIESDIDQCLAIKKTISKTAKGGKRGDY